MCSEELDSVDGVFGLALYGCLLLFHWVVSDCGVIASSLESSAKLLLFYTCLYMLAMLTTIMGAFIATPYAAHEALTALTDTCLHIYRLAAALLGDILLTVVSDEERKISVL